MANNIFIPSDPNFVAMRPINRGIVHNLPTNGLPQGALLQAKNFIVKSTGPMRRPGIYTRANSPNTDPIRNIETLWGISGAQTTFVFDTKHLYKYDGTNTLSPLYSAYITGTVAGTLGTKTITSTSTVWLTNDILPGDILIVDGNTYNISTVATDTSLTLAENLLTTFSGVTYIIRRRINPYESLNQLLVDLVVADNKLIWTDYNRTLRFSTGATTADYSSDLANIQAGCIGYFKDRIWIANINDAGSVYKFRIKWSSATDRTSFNAADYYDLPYSNGHIMRLVPFSNLMAAYFTDALYLGRPSNYANLPLVFERYDTKGIGLVGTQAVTRFIGGHLFIGQDNIYFFSNQALEPIGTPIVKDTIRATKNQYLAWVTPDPQNERVVFGFPELGSELQKIWSFDYKSKSWSYDEIESASSASLIGFYYNQSWDDTTATWDSEDRPWQMFLDQTIHEHLYFGTVNGNVWMLTDNAAQDNNTSNIPVELETPDFDYGLPDELKTWFRLSLKIDRNLYSDETLLFTVTGSTNHGRTYKALGDLTIKADEDEGKLNFRLTGSIGRFKLISDSTVKSYTISEMVFRVRMRGKEKSN